MPREGDDVERIKDGVERKDIGSRENNKKRWTASSCCILHYTYKYTNIHGNIIKHNDELQ